MAGGGGVDDDDPVPGPGHDFCKGPEHGDFLGAGGTEVFFDVCQVSFLQSVFPGLVQDFLLIPAELGLFVDLTQLDPVRLFQDFLEMASRVGGGQQHLAPLLSQPESQGCSHGGFPHAAFAHGEDNLPMVLLQIFCHLLEGMDGSLLFPAGGRSNFSLQESPDMVQAGNIVAPEGNLPAGHFFQTLGHFFQSRLLFGKKFPGDRVIGFFQ